MLYEMGLFMRMLCFVGEILAGPTASLSWTAVMRPSWAFKSCLKQLVTRKNGVRSEKKEGKNNESISGSKLGGKIKTVEYLYHG